MRFSVQRHPRCAGLRRASGHTNPPFPSLLKTALPSGPVPRLEESLAQKGLPYTSLLLMNSAKASLFSIHEAHSSRSSSSFQLVSFPSEQSGMAPYCQLGCIARDRFVDCPVLVLYVRLLSIPFLGENPMWRIGARLDGLVNTSLIHAEHLLVVYKRVSNERQTCVYRRSQSRASRKCQHSSCSSTWKSSLSNRNKLLALGSRMSDVIPSDKTRPSFITKPKGLEN